MKKAVFFLFAALFSLPKTATAQDQKVNFGIKVAPAIAWTGVDNPYAENNGAKAKCNAGIMLAFNLSDNISIVSGLNVNSIGGKMKATSKHPELKAIFSHAARFTELELPVAFQWKTDEIGPMRYYAKIGFGAGAILKARNDEKEKIDKKYYNTIVASYQAGIGAEYKVASHVSLVGELRFDGGISSITRSKNIKKDLPVDEFRSRCNFLELGVGVLF